LVDRQQANAAKCHDVRILFPHGTLQTIHLDTTGTIGDLHRAERLAE